MHINRARRRKNRPFFVEKKEKNQLIENDSLCVKREFCEQNAIELERFFFFYLRWTQDYLKTGM